MAEAEPLTSAWLKAHPLPPPADDADKNARGRVLAIGGGARVPGGLLLTAEGALRAGAGKVRMAAPDALAIPLGLAMPEAGMIALGQCAEGEILPAGLARNNALAEALARSDAVVVGPAMGDADAAGALVDMVIATAPDEACLVLDAAALMQAGPRASALANRAGCCVMTPHLGEIAAMLQRPAEAIAINRTAAAREAAETFGAVVVVKGAETLIASPSGLLLAYAGGGVGLATGGSGDVQAGLAAGLAARGADAFDAACWAVWLHGEAGRRCAERIGPLGFLARDLLAHVPALMRGL